MKDAGVQASFSESASAQELGRLPHPDSEFPQVLYQHHTILWGLFACALLYYVVLSQPPEGDNSKNGLIAAVAMLLFCSAVHLPDSHYMARPHPVAWRVLEGVTLCYISFLVFVSFQSTDDARRLLKWFDPTLGVALSDRNYAEDCRVFTPENPDSNFFNVKSCVFDVYIIAHFIGWWLKMIIVRDVKMCWFLSILFEFMEISLRHQLPNFSECWWDSLVLDILICNGGGIYFGYLTCSFFEMRQYHWGVGGDIRHNTGRFGLLARSAVQLTPFSWKAYKWDLLASPRNFVAVLLYATLFILVDLSNFYLKSVLWIPPAHELLQARAIYWAILAVILTREYYEYVYSGRREKLGAFCWLGAFALALEWLIVLKNSQGIFDAEVPNWIATIWTCIAMGVLGEISFLVYQQGQPKAEKITYS